VVVFGCDRQAALSLGAFVVAFDFSHRPPRHSPSDPPI
jgi:hypothetical protein